MRLAEVMIWLLILQESISISENWDYTLEKYEESPGIYYQSQGQINLYNTEWSVVVYVNLTKMDRQSQKIEQYVKHINKVCHEVGVRNWTDCNHFQEIAKDRLLQIKKTEDIIFDITDHKTGKVRTKRGVFNFIGEISKVLFGTMDNEDAQYYNEQIKHFEENSEDITTLLKQQLIVVKSSLGSINSTLTDMEYNEEKVKTGLLQLKSYLEAVTSENKESLNILNAKITVEGHIAKVGEATNALQRTLDILLQSIVNARKGILQPQIVSPKVIMDALTQSIPSFPKDTTSPFPLSKSSLNLIYKTCDIHVYIDEGILGYVITLPLINTGTFKIYRMIPVPIPLGNNKFAYINTKESYLCIDQTRQYYFEIGDKELNDCKMIDSQKRLCKQKQPLLSSHSHESCAVKLLQPRKEIPKSCDTRVVQFKHTIWTQLDNEWMYFTPTSESVTVLCNEKEPINVILSGVGKFGLNIGCKGYSLVALLQTSVTINAKGIKRDDILSQAPLEFDCLEELKFHFNTSSKLASIEFKQVASHLDDLKHASYKISELEKQIEEQEWKNHQITKHSTYSVIVYILLSLSAIYAVYKLYKYIRGRFTPVRNLKALTDVQAHAGTQGSGNTVNINIKTSNESLALAQEEIPLQTLQEENTPRRSLRPRAAKSYF